MTPPKLLPPHYFVLSLILIIGIGWMDTSTLLASPWPLFGILPILLGVGLAAQGSRLFARAGTNIVPFTESTALVTDGVFRFSRNPMYTGMILALIGTALLANSLFAWLILIPFVAIIRGFFISNEERLMEETFGEEYLSYKGSVRRWL